MSKFCTGCGASLPDNAKFCTECGKPVESPVYEEPVSYGESEAERVAASYGEARPSSETGAGAYGADPVSSPSGAAPNYTYAQATTYPSQPLAPYGTPGWKTNVGFSVLGAVGIFLVTALTNNLAPVPALLVSLVFAVAGIAYAMAVYPKFFEPTGFEGKDSRLVSFLNLFFGGIIFGCIWNANLTNGKKGVSYIVFTVLEALALLGSLSYLAL